MISLENVILTNLKLLPIIWAGHFQSRNSEYSILHSSRLKIILLIIIIIIIK